MKIKNIIAVSLVTSFILFGVVSYTKAAATDSIFGTAWSSNIGWVSSNNCIDTTTCAGSSYGVAIDQTSGAMSGYMWSSNIGWISFSGARVDFVTKNSDGSFALRGWAQACSVFVSGCSGALENNAYRGDWDGRIALSSKDGGGTATWGWQINTDQTITGYAWGSDVVGWVKAHNLRLEAPVVATPPTVVLVISPTAINPGGSAVLNWVSTGATTCTGVNFDAGGKLSGSLVVYPTVPLPPTWPNDTVRYVINCVGANGVTVTDDALIAIVLPPVTCVAPKVLNPTSGLCENPVVPPVVPPVVTPPGGGGSCIAPKVLNPTTGLCETDKVKIIYKEI